MTLLGTSRILLAGAAVAMGLVIVLPIVVLALPFWALAALHDLGERALARSRPSTVRWQDLMVYEPEIGWRARGGVNAWADGSPPFHVRTDPDGWRGPATTIEDADVVVFGDSFAWGAGADEEAFFANLPGKARVKAIGANGYNMVQGLLWMRRYAPRLRGKVVVWLVYYGNDLYENLQPNMGRYRIPFVRQEPVSEQWSVVTHHVSRAPWRFSRRVPYMKLLADICTPTPVSKRVFGACEYLIGRGASLCSAANARLVVMGIPTIESLDSSRLEGFVNLSTNPSACDVRLPDERLSAACLEYGVCFVPLEQHLEPEDYLEEDVHWSTRGHRKVSRVLQSLAYASTSGAGPAGRVVPAVRGGWRQTFVGR